MSNSLTAKKLAISLLAALAISSAKALTPVRVEQTLSTLPDISKGGHNEALAQSIIQLFNEDQAFLADLEKAKQDTQFQQTQKSYVERSRVKDHNPNFYDAAVYALWAQMPDAPELVQRYASFRKSTDAHVELIVSRDGWPRRVAVGDEAAADFFFLFGHADNDNAWRVTQLPTIKRVFREDHLNPRLYAHVCDRLANVAGKPQIYGSVMGPGATPGTAKLYWPLVDNMAAADERRIQIGLPSIESDLEVFRRGANIGPYMTPMTKGKDWSIADVYMAP